MSQDAENKQLLFNSARGVVKLTVLSEKGDTYIVCHPEEYEAAIQQGRAPISVGFRKSDVVKKGVDMRLTLKHNGQYGKRAKASKAGRNHFRSGRRKQR